MKVFHLSQRAIIVGQVGKHVEYLAVSGLVVLAGVRALNRGVNGVFMTEGVSLGIGSCLFAIPVSYPITNLVASAIGPMATGSPWTGTFTATGVLIWIVIILSLLANYIPARNASRLTVR